MPEDTKTRSTADLQAALDAANARIAQLTAAKVQNEADEKIINERIARGVTRQQAIAAIKRQRDFDASDYGKMVVARNARRQATKRTN